MAACIDVRSVTCPIVYQRPTGSREIPCSHERIVYWASSTSCYALTRYSVSHYFHRCFGESKPNILIPGRQQYKGSAVSAISVQDAFD